MIWDVIQEVEISNLRSGRVLSDGITESRIADAHSDIEQLHIRFDRMLLVMDAMWELLAERAGVTDDDLLAKVREIDGRDGSVDGRRTTLARRCSQCGAAVGNDRDTCMFCGHPEPGRTGIDAI